MAESERAGRVDFRVSREMTDPFRVWVCETPLGGLNLSSVPPASDPAWRVPGMGAVYANDCESRKRTTRDYNAMPPLVAATLAWLRSRPLVREWSRLTGIDGLEDDPTLHGGGLHVTAAGGWLNPHLDYARHPHVPDRERRLSLILFLNNEWREEWGGAFLVCHPDGSVAHKVYPAPGRLLAFETGDVSYHGTEPTSADAPDRVSLAAYYLSPARPGATRVRALFLPKRGA